MEIKQKHTNQSGEVIDIVYKEDDLTKNSDGVNSQAVHAFCFYNDKLVVVYHHGKKHWTPIGGAIEPGETYEQSVVREVKEEANMRVISQKLIGYIDIYESNKIIRQTRSVCIVEPYGDFVSDPDGDITEIKLIDPKDYKKYFDWKEAGDRILERALELKKSLEK